MRQPGAVSFLAAMRAAPRLRIRSVFLPMTHSLSGIETVRKAKVSAAHQKPDALRSIVVQLFWKTPAVRWDTIRQPGLVYGIFRMKTTVLFVYAGTSVS